MSILLKFFVCRSDKLLALASGFRVFYEKDSVPGKNLAKEKNLQPADNELRVSEVLANLHIRSEVILKTSEGVFNMQVSADL